jgi:hypothetical protein
LKITHIPPRDIEIVADLRRTSRSRVFEDHLRASIEEIGLVEPIKVAMAGSGQYVILDGVLRWNAISAIRLKDPSRFRTVPAYVFSFQKRYEIRYQTDIYQDLLPSQLAALVEHLHEHENISKRDIARYIGISSATLRNYTGLWRLVQRGGLFGLVVALMDARVFPASNPYAWLRLTTQGLRTALQATFTNGMRVEAWMDEQLKLAAQGVARPFPIAFIEAATDALPASCYRQGEAVRAAKRDIGLRRRMSSSPMLGEDLRAVTRHLMNLQRHSPNAVIRAAAGSLRDFVR